MTKCHYNKSADPRHNIIKIGDFVYVRSCTIKWLTASFKEIKAAPLPPSTDHTHQCLSLKQNSDLEHYETPQCPDLTMLCDHPVEQSYAPSQETSNNNNSSIKLRKALCATIQKSLNKAQVGYLLNHPPQPQ